MESDIRYLVNQGKTYFKNQAFKKAETIFLKVISGNHEFADVYNMLGVISHQSGQSNKAITFFDKALGINPNYTEAMLNLSVLYNDLGEYKRSKQLLSKSKKASRRKGDVIDPFIRGKLSNKHAETGDLYQGIGLYKQAIEEYQKALELASHFYDIRNRLGICLREEGQKQEAIKEFKRIIKESPNFGDASVQLGITLFSLGQRDEARKVWQQLVKSNSHHELAKMYLRLSEEPGTQKKKSSPTSETKAKAKKK